jgi:hypothetical protein
MVLAHAGKKKCVLLQEEAGEEGGEGGEEALGVVAGRGRLEEFLKFGSVQVAEWCEGLREGKREGGREGRREGTVKVQEQGMFSHGGYTPIFSSLPPSLLPSLPPSLPPSLSPSLLLLSTYLPLFLPPSLPPVLPPFLGTLRQECCQEEEEKLVVEGRGCFAGV